jgi:hypothetical protein
MDEVKEQFISTEDEGRFVLEIDDLKYLLVDPEPDPLSDRPMEYMGQSGLTRMTKMFKPEFGWQRKRFRLTLLMPPDKVTPDTGSEAKAMLRKRFDRQVLDNENQLKLIRHRGFSQIPRAFLFLMLCISLGLFFGNETFYAFAPIVASALSEGFYIIGWVSLWGPTDTLLFEPMTLRRENKVLRMLMNMEVEVVKRPSPNLL